MAKAVHKGKDARAEQQLTDRQKRTIYEMWERDSDAPGAALGFITERFSQWELTPDAIRAIVTAERAKRRGATDWAKAFQSTRSLN